MPVQMKKVNYFAFMSYFCKKKMTFTSILINKKYNKLQWKAIQHKLCTNSFKCSVPFYLDKKICKAKADLTAHHSLHYTEESTFRFWKMANMNQKSAVRLQIELRRNNDTTLGNLNNKIMQLPQKVVVAFG